MADQRDPILFSYIFQETEQSQIVRPETHSKETLFIINKSIWYSFEV